MYACMYVRPSPRGRQAEAGRPAGRQAMQAQTDEHAHTHRYIYIYMLPPLKAHRFHDFRHNLAGYCSASTLCRHQAARTQEQDHRNLRLLPWYWHSLSLLLVKMCNIPCSY